MGCGTESEDVREVECQFRVTELKPGVWYVNTVTLDILTGETVLEGHDVVLAESVEDVLKTLSDAIIEETGKDPEIENDYPLVSQPAENPGGRLN